MIGSPLPSASRAQISPEKLRDYVLNPRHPDGSHKARVFLAALGITQAEWENLRAQILVGVQAAPVVGEREDRHGTRYEVTVGIVGRDGREARVTTAWFAATVDDAPQAGVRLRRCGLRLTGSIIERACLNAPRFSTTWP